MRGTLITRWPFLVALLLVALPLLLAGCGHSGGKWG